MDKHTCLTCRLFVPLERRALTEEGDIAVGYCDETREPCRDGDVCNEWEGYEND